MRNLRLYGNRPFRVAVIHGGPGAPGEMAPVARELSVNHGVLEPFQTKSTIEGQLQELKGVLRQNGQPPMTLIGHSWGAMLSFILAAKYPALVSKLILVSSGVFEDGYATDIMNTRLGRLSVDERAMLESLLHDLDKPGDKGKNEIFAQLGKLAFKTDSYDAQPAVSDIIEYQHDIYESVWHEAKELRHSGEVLLLGKDIRCPVVAVHGDYDPHPADGVSIPLSTAVQDFRFIRLTKCGHYPWLEKHARARFFEILTEELVHLKQPQASREG